MFPQIMFLEWHIKDIFSDSPDYSVTDQSYTVTPSPRPYRSRSISDRTYKIHKIFLHIFSTLGMLFIPLILSVAPICAELPLDLHGRAEVEQQPLPLQPGVEPQPLG
jgi:hypothetical protein